MLDVVVIDDDSDFLSLVTTQLRRQMQVRVTTFRQGRVALAYLFEAERLAADLVIIDLLLPDISGYEIVSEIRKHPKTTTVPCLIASARNGLEEHARADEVGADAFLEKPFRTRELLDLVERLATKGRRTA